jgi:hypothetical protein
VGNGDKVKSMATPNRPLIDLLRTTAARLESGSRYSWGHAGQCNCGHLVQAATGLTSGEIHRRMLAQAHERALHRGEWSEHAEAYCGDSGMEVEFIFEALMEIGLATADLSHLEYLSDPKVLARLPGDRRSLKRSERADAITYMRAWAELLEGEFEIRTPVPKQNTRQRLLEPVLV